MQLATYSQRKRQFFIRLYIAENELTMALEEFQQSDQEIRRRGYESRRSLMDIGMGTLWAGMGVFLLFRKHLSYDITTNLETRFGDTPLNMFGGLCVIYGAFRIYRGFQKKYYRD